MKWEELLSRVGGEPVFESALLLAGRVSIAQIRVQLSRWVRSGRLLQLRRGLYALAPAWRKVVPSPFLVANRFRPGSYVSFQSALSFHGHVPEHVPVVTSAGSGRPGRIATPLGTYQFSHLVDDLLFGYGAVEVAAGQKAFVARPEKALLDLVHLTPGGDDPAFLKELRLQNLSNLDAGMLAELAQRSARPKLVRAARAAVRLIAEGDGEPL
jgi:predicted transcriptional regulator of viral defense system